MLEILKQGVEDGRFRNDINTRLVREIVLGMLDFEGIGVLASGEMEESVSDLEGIMSLMSSMIVRRDESDKKIPKRENILLAAEKVFAEKPFTKAKISEIAEVAEVSEGTVYEYFENKEDLLLSIPIRYLENYLDTLPEIFHVRNPIKKLRRLMRYHFSMLLMNPDFLKVFLLQIQLNKRFYGSKAFKGFLDFFQVIEGIIEEGKLEGILRSDVNPRIFRNMFLGAFTHMALRWLIFGTDMEADKMQEINEVIDLLCTAVSAGDAEKLIA